MKKPAIHITDHALLRYLERVLGYDVEALRRQLGREVASRTSGQACAVRMDGFQYRIENKAVVTITSINRPDIRRGRRTRRD
ncbi:hypothetical protein [Profundibacter sp.]|jgi:hypothetical protein